MSGYLDRAYAESLAEFGTPLHLPRCGGWLLERPCPGGEWRDAMGPYPLFMCRDWSGLAQDVAALGERLVSLTIVSDPFAPVEPAGLSASFNLVRPFKTHYVLDLETSRDKAISRHHREVARQSLGKLQVEVCSDPAGHLDEWMQVFAVLVDRHRLGGIKAPSRAAFARQLATPGLVMFRAAAAGRAVGFQLWFVTGAVAYGHLMASTPAGYAAAATFGLTATAIEHFAGRVRWLDFGGVSGADDLGSSSLLDFKRGWTNDTRIAYLCGRILAPQRYRTLAGSFAGSAYFPAYRAGELTGTLPGVDQCAAGAMP